MVPTSVATVIWPSLTGKSSVVLPLAGASAVALTPAFLRAADIAGLMTTSVLMPMTVAFADEYVVLGDVLGIPPLLGAAVLLPGGLLLLGVLPLLALLLLGLLLQAATTTPAATITVIAEA